MQPVHQRALLLVDPVIVTKAAYDGFRRIVVSKTVYIRNARPPA